MQAGRRRRSDAPLPSISLPFPRSKLSLPSVLLTPCLLSPSPSLLLTPCLSLSPSPFLSPSPLSLRAGVRVVGASGHPGHHHAAQLRSGWARRGRLLIGGCFASPLPLHEGGLIKKKKEKKKKKKRKRKRRRRRRRRRRMPRRCL